MGVVHFIDPDTVVYVPHRPTTADARASLLHLRHTGILRPVPGHPEQRERVYPVDAIPTDSPNVFDSRWARDDGEIFAATLVIRFSGTATTRGPWSNANPFVPLDQFRPYLGPRAEGDPIL